MCTSERFSLQGLAPASSKQLLLVTSYYPGSESQADFLCGFGSAFILGKPGAPESHRWTSSVIFPYPEVVRSPISEPRMVSCHSHRCGRLFLLSFSTCAVEKTGITTLYSGFKSFVPQGERSGQGSVPFLQQWLHSPHNSFWV